MNATVLLLTLLVAQPDAPKEKLLGYIVQNGIKKPIYEEAEKAAFPNYNEAGLVPGGDTVLSEELPWYLLDGLSLQQRLEILRSINQ